MVADHEEAYSSPAIYADDSASTDPYDLEATKWLVPAALVLFAMLLLEIVVLFAWRSPGEAGMVIRYGQSGIVGFYLACGWAKWWVRWLTAIAAVLAFSLTMIEQLNPDDFIKFSVLIMTSAGFTYLVRMIVSVIRGESNPLQRFTIFGLMIVTAIVAACAMGMNQLPEFQEPARGVSMVITMAMFGLSLIAQCALLWTTTRRQLIAFGVSALVLAFIMPFAIYGVFYLSQDRMPPISRMLVPCWVMIVTTWLTLYPLVFVFYGMGGSLINPSWKLKPRHKSAPRTARGEEDVDVLMED